MRDDELQRAIGRMEGKLDEIHTSQKTLSERLNDHSTRIRALERWRSWITGIGATLAVMWTGLTAWFGTRG